MDFALGKYARLKPCAPAQRQTSRSAEEGLAHCFFGGLPAFDGLIDDDCGVGDSHPETDFFDGESSPCGNADAQHLFVAKVPPAVGYSEVASQMRLTRRTKKAARLKARQLMTGRAEGSKADDGTRAVIARKMK